MANNATYPLSAFIRVWYLFFPYRPLFLVLVFSLPAAVFGTCFFLTGRCFWYLFFPYRPLFLVLVFSSPAAAFALWPPRFNQWRPFHLPALPHFPGNQGNLRHQPVEISPHFHTAGKNMVVPFHIPTHTATIRPNFAMRHLPKSPFLQRYSR